jgi:ClpX C4-type zinc finger
MNNRNAYCSFCRKSHRDVGPLVEGPGEVYICGDCIELCSSIIEQQRQLRHSAPAKPVAGIGSPKSLANPLKSGVWIGSKEALAIAEADAVKEYPDLTVYQIWLSLEADGWHVDYEPKDPTIKGGGAHYVIDAVTGGIISKRCEQ